jgi:hypothetical protein
MHFEIIQQHHVMTQRIISSSCIIIMIMIIITCFLGVGYLLIGKPNISKIERSSPN